MLLSPRSHAPLRLVVGALSVAMLHGSASMAQSDRGNQTIEAVLKLTPDVRRGKTLYDQLCSSCHGRSAAGSAETIVPTLAGQLRIYLIKQMVDLSEGDRLNPTMHRVLARKELTAEQALSDIASYVSGLPTVAAPEFGPGNDLAIGHRYYDGLCAFCHGAKGEGNEEHATPVLARQHYSYLLLQMKDLSQGHRYSVDVAVMQTLQALPADTLKALADYTSRLPASANGPKDSSALDAPAADDQRPLR